MKLFAFLSGIFFGLKVSNDDKEYTYIYLSESLAALQGYTCEEFVKVCENSAYKNIHPLDRERVHRISMAQYDKGNFFSVKYRVIHKNGSIIWIQDYGKRVQMSDGTIRHYGLIQDITEKEIAEQMKCRQQNINYYVSQIREKWTSYSNNKIVVA